MNRLPPERLRLHPLGRYWCPRFQGFGQVETIVRWGAIDEATLRLDDGRRFTVRADEVIPFAMRMH
jgi:hypothetical protein